MEVKLPFVIHPRVRKGFCRLATLTALGVIGSTGVAAAATCPSQPTTTPFTQWSDTGSYFLAPNGNFEGSSLPSTWTVSGASLVPGNEPFRVGGSSDKQSLQINAGGSVTTDFPCVDSTMPSLRFFAHQASAGSDLRVTLLVVTPYGSTLSIPITDLADGSMPSWGLTGQLAAANGMTVPAGMTVQAALRFDVPASSGSWQIDDIYVDPYRSA